MLVKILARHTLSFAGLLKYIFNKEKLQETDHVITHNLRGTTQEAWTHEFLQNEAIFRTNFRRDGVYLTHEILALSSNEESSLVTPEIMKDLANQYIRLRGVDGMFAGAVHRDKKSCHIHFCVSNLRYRSSRSFHIGKTEMQTLKQELQEYHRRKYPFLTNSFCDHGSNREYVTDREWFAKNRNTRTLHKEHIQKIVLACFQKAKTLPHFLDLLRENNLHHYERRGIPTGIIDENNMKFRFSRLGLEPVQLSKLPPDFTEEQLALNTIQQIRKTKRSIEKENTIDR